MQEPPNQTSRLRLGYVDAGRAFAMLLMIQAHVCDTLLAPAFKDTEIFRQYWSTRGVTGPLFFMLSGFAFVVASDSHWEAFGRRGPKLYKRLRRVLSLMLIGYFFQMPRWRGNVPFDFTHEEWQYVLRAGVLHCIGWSLLGALCLIAATRSKRAFTWGAVAWAAVAIALAPFLRTTELELPLALRMLLQPDAGSFFPLFPASAYFAIGLVMARLHLDHRERFAPARRLALWVGAAAVALIVGREIFVAIWPAQAGQAEHLMGAPLTVFTRLGRAWAIFAMLALVVGDLRSPAWLKSVASNALSIYVLHLVAIYGAPHLEGLLQRTRGDLTLAQTFVTGPLLLLGCAAVMAAWDAASRFARRLRPATRRPALTTAAE